MLFVLTFRRNVLPLSSRWLNWLRCILKFWDGRKFVSYIEDWRHYIILKQWHILKMRGYLYVHLKCENELEDGGSTFVQNIGKMEHTKQCENTKYGHHLDCSQHENLKTTIPPFSWWGWGILWKAAAGIARLMWKFEPETSLQNSATHSTLMCGMSDMLYIFKLVLVFNDVKSTKKVPQRSRFIQSRRLYTFQLAAIIMNHISLFKDNETN